MIHVADLAECKFQCDLFNSFVPVTGLFMSRQEVWMRTATSLGLARRPWPTTCPAATGLAEPSATKTGSALTVPTPFAQAAPTARDVCPVLQIRVDSWWKQNVS